MSGDLKGAAIFHAHAIQARLQPNEKRYLGCPVHTGLFINVQHLGDQ